MTLLKEKLDEFIAVARNLAQVDLTFDSDAFHDYLCCRTPIITDEELGVLESMVNKYRNRKIGRLRSALLDEIEANDISFATNYQFEKYSGYIKSKLEPIALALNKYSYAEQIVNKKLKPNLIGKSVKRLTKESRAEYIHAHLDQCYFGVIDIYKNIQAVLKELDNVRQTRGIISSESYKSAVSDNQPTLKSFFSDAKLFDPLMTFMIERKLVLSSESGLIWRGHRSNRKYEIASFFEALYNANFIRRRLRNNEIISISQNTFLKLTISSKTVNNINYHNHVEDYKKMLAEFRK